MQEKLNYNPIRSIPEPLEDLKPNARYYYNYICQVLISNKSLTAADVPAITQAAILYGIFSDASAMITKEGYFQMTQSGYTAKNAHMQVMNDAYKSIKFFENLYGFNLASRGKINVSHTKEDDPFDNI